MDFIFLLLEDCICNLNSNHEPVGFVLTPEEADAWIEQAPVMGTRIKYMASRRWVRVPKYDSSENRIPQ